MIRPGVLLITGVLILPTAVAEPLIWNVDPDNTHVMLSWYAFGNAFSNAVLSGATGSVVLEPGQDFKDRVDVSIPATTLKASNALLTGQLRSELFFDVQRYRLITFNSSRVVDKGNGHFQIFGELQVKQIHRPIMIEATMNKVQGAWSTEKVLSLHATTAISRSAFGLNRFSMLVDDRVAIAIDIQARRRESATIPPTPVAMNGRSVATNPGTVR